MAAMDVFKGDAFSTQSLLSAIEDVDHKPQLLGSMNLFKPRPVRTRDVLIESRNNQLTLIQTTPIGAPPAQAEHDKRAMRTVRTVRIAKSDRVMAEEVQGIREFGSETELMQAQQEVARRLQGLHDDVELTWEFHRLGAVQGKVADADGSTLVDYYSLFDVEQPAVVDFNFGALAAGEVRPLIEGIVRDIIRASKGAFLPSSRVAALTGDDFWDALVNHKEVRETYLNQTAAAALREGTAFGRFSYAGVDWINYRGTDDNSTVAIATDEAKFFPVNAPGVFEVAWAPAEFWGTVNRPGVPETPKVLVDPSGREAFVDVELYSYPLFICTRPLSLRRAALDT